jgi:ribonucleoside-diphosphate reductase alpha subunit
MQVVKRDGRYEDVSFDKVLERIRRAADGLSVNPTALAQKILAQIYNGVKTTELDDLTSQLAASLATVHPDYGVLAGRITISNHQKNTDASFVTVLRALSNQTSPKTGEPLSYIHPDLLAFVEANAETIEARIDHNRDYLLDYFGFKTLEKSYLLKDTSGKILERPQHLWMRVSLALWANTEGGLDHAFETYDLMSQKYFTHATPTLFNAGTPRQQLSSCFLLAMHDDSIAGIYKTLSDCALISKYAGGIGIHCHNIRAKGAIIRGTNGTSNGLVPMLRVFNNTARYVDQCFTPDTLIVTRNGEKRIADIEAGDEVLTSGCEESVEEGVKHYVHSESGPKFCRVSKRVEHLYSGTMYHIETTLDDGVVDVTENHPFLVQLNEGHENNYIEAKNINIGDYMFRPTLDEVGKSFKKAKSWSVSRVVTIEPYTVENKVLYDLEIDGTHDYMVANVGFAHNGGGKRNGSFAMYLEPWHADVEDFLKLKLGTGSEEDRARDLFYALWIPDLFMERVDADADWTLFCPSEAPGLADVHSKAFNELYLKYEREGRGRKTVSARKLWFQILDAQMETGTPYLLYKDAANSKSNQQNLGTIKSSNLCSEIIEYSDANESAVCNLASIGLPAFVTQEGFDFAKLRTVVTTAVRNLNRVIDINYYPTPETQRSNMRHRPIGLGVQGLADVFAMLKLEWDSADAADLHQRIFEHMYFAAVEESVRIAMEDGPYETFQGSPASKGQLQPDLWGTVPLTETSKELDWVSLREYVVRYGLRNSLLMAPMPTASTSQILGYNECFEPFTSNLYTRRTLAGEYIVVNKYLLKDLVDLGVWNEDLKQKIIAQNGSVQGIAEIPVRLQNLYKTSWELKQRTLIDLAATRGAFICQSQSLNLFVADPTYAKLTSMHFYAWRKGLKTGCYYLRTKAAVTAQKFTVDPKFLSQTAAPVQEADHKQDEVSPQQSTIVVVADSKLSRKELLERLAKEYEEEQKKAKEATENGEGCLMCSG